MPAKSWGSPLKTTTKKDIKHSFSDAYMKQAIFERKNGKVFVSEMNDLIDSYEKKHQKNKTLK